MFNLIEKYIDGIGNNIDMDIVYNKTIKKFGNDTTNIHIINFIMYDKYNYFIYNEDNYDLTNKRMGQDDFRKAIIDRDKTCIISNVSSQICEACHIIPHSKSKNYHISNGIMLSRNLHALFDKYDLSFNDNIVVLSDNIMNNSEFHEVHKYNGKKVKIPRECISNLKIHYNDFLNKK